MEETARRIVAEWLVEIWVKRPDWLARMPNEDDVKSLIDLIAKNFADLNKGDPL